MRKLIGIVFLILGIVQICYSQYYSKSFLLNNTNTIPANLLILNENIFITGFISDTNLITPYFDSHFISKFNINGNKINNISYKPNRFSIFQGTSSQGTSYFINNKIVTCGLSIDTGTNARNYLVCFYDTNCLLNNYFTIPTLAPQGGLTDITFTNNHYYATGSKNNVRSTLLVKIDTLGNKISELNYPILSTATNNLAQTIIPVDSGDLIIAIGGYKEFLPGSGQLHSLIYKTTLLRTDSLGGQKWQWTDTSNNGQAPYSFQKTSDGGYVSCGSYVGYRAYNDTDDYALYMPYVVKWNSNFTKQWENYETPIDIGYRQGIIYDVKELSDGNFIACGLYSEGSVYGYIVKINAIGDIIWSKQYRSYQFPETYSQHRLYDLDILSNGDIVAVGEINPNDGISIPQQGWILRVDSNGCIVDSNWCGWNSIEVEPTPNTWQSSKELFIYPNPAIDIINITFKNSSLNLSDKLNVRIFDVQGREVYNEKTNYKDLIQLNVSFFERGIYFIKINSEDNKIVSNGKFICR